jgi:hypothetical protein
MRVLGNLSRCVWVVKSIWGHFHTYYLCTQYALIKVENTLLPSPMHVSTLSYTDTCRMEWDSIVILTQDPKCGNGAWGWPNYNTTYWFRVILYFVHGQMGLPNLEWWSFLSLADFTSRRGKDNSLGVIVMAGILMKWGNFITFSLLEWREKQSQGCFPLFTLTHARRIRSFGSWAEKRERERESTGNVFYIMYVFMCIPSGGKVETLVWQVKGKYWRG